MESLTAAQAAADDKVTGAEARIVSANLRVFVCIFSVCVFSVCGCPKLCIEADRL